MAGEAEQIVGIAGRCIQQARAVVGGQQDSSVSTPLR